MNTTLRTLIFESGLTQEKFAEAVGVKYNTLTKQLAKDNTISHSFKYARILGVKEIKGYESGCYVELVIA